MLAFYSSYSSTKDAMSSISDADSMSYDDIWLDSDSMSIWIIIEFDFGGINSSYLVGRKIGRKLAENILRKISIIIKMYIVQMFKRIKE